MGPTTEKPARSQNLALEASGQGHALSPPTVPTSETEGSCLLLSMHDHAGLPSELQNSEQMDPGYLEYTCLRKLASASSKLCNMKSPVSLIMLGHAVLSPTVPTPETEGSCHLLNMHDHAGWPPWIQNSEKMDPGYLQHACPRKLASAGSKLCIMRGPVFLQCMATQPCLRRF